MSVAKRVMTSCISKKSKVSMMYWEAVQNRHSYVATGSLKCNFFFSLEKEKEDQEKQEKEEQEKTVEQTSVKEADKTSRTGRRPSRSALSNRNDRKSAKSPQRTDAPKENKHPFALYGWGERQTDTGSQKTHNVRASASVNEVSKSFCFIGRQWLLSAYRCLNI